jgi:hypothetical protein
MAASTQLVDGGATERHRRQSPSVRRQVLGRPLPGIAVDGEAGARHVLELRDELDLAMALRARRLEDLTRDLVVDRS